MVSKCYNTFYYRKKQAVTAGVCVLTCVNVCVCVYAYLLQVTQWQQQLVVVCVCSRVCVCLYYRCVCVSLLQVAQWNPRFVCPLGGAGEPMQHPVLAADGNTYDRT